jgi:hypothetical protein
MAKMKGPPGAATPFGWEERRFPGILALARLLQEPAAKRGDGI